MYYLVFDLDARVLVFACCAQIKNKCARTVGLCFYESVFISEEVNITFVNL